MINENSSNLRKVFVPVALAATLLAPAYISAREITVTGRVTSLKTGEPLPAVTIIDVANDHLLGSTTEEGYYQITVDDNAQLLFTTMASVDQTINVSGQQRIDVKLEPTAVTLDEVVVMGNRVNHSVQAEQADLDVKGNMLHIKTHLRMPKHMFSTSERMIVQPVVYNITRKTTTNLKPVVVDGRRYAITQERMLDWNRDADPLTPYVEIRRDVLNHNGIITINDSAYIANPDEDYRCDLYMVLEDYNKVKYRDTTTIGRGVVNPLRFLNYDLAGQFVDQQAYLPKPELQLRDSKGDVNLTFGVGKTKLDMSLGQNQSEMAALQRLISSIENNPDVALKSFTIRGIASPEGDPERNRELALGRMESAMEVIAGRMGENTRRNAEMKTEADVASWSDLVTLLRADGLNTEADEVTSAIANFKTPQHREMAVRRLPFFKMLAENYLPRLRKVEYEIVTSQYRYPTDDEIQDLYIVDPSKMSRYEFWRLYSIANSNEEKEPIMKKALEVHPAFTVAATDLAAIRIAQGNPDITLLEEAVAKGKDLPDATRLNQAIALMSNSFYSEADSLGLLLPNDPRYHKAKIYARASSGNFEEVMQEVAADSPFNEVLLLLAVKANDHAWRKAKQLGDSAREEYIKAVAANRMDQYMEAVSHLSHAFELDPSLREIAKVDGDLLDLLEDESLN